jgi:RNA polymerase sigma factor (sigma-70 family)
MPSPVDRELIAQCLAGRDAAWESLVERYSSLIYSVPFKYGLSEEDAAEVFQNVCLLWWQNLAQIQDIDRLAGWLVTLAARSSWRVIESRRRARVHEFQDVDELMSTVPTHDDLPEEEVLARERSASLRAAIGRLDERCQVLIAQLFFDPNPPDYAEIAAAFGLAEGSIGALRKRCLDRLRREIAGKSVQGAFLETGAGTK